MLPVAIQNPATRKQAKVTKNGQLVVGAVSYDDVSAQLMGTDNTAVNFFGPKAGQQFVITGIILTADKNVTTDCIVDIYEADTATSTTSTKDIITVEMLKNTARDITGLNLLVTQGKYINGKTDDDDVYATMMGYYIDKL